MWDDGSRSRRCPRLHPSDRRIASTRHGPRHHCKHRIDRCWDVIASIVSMEERRGEEWSGRMALLPTSRVTSSPWVYYVTTSVASFVAGEFRSDAGDSCVKVEHAE